MDDAPSSPDASAESTADVPPVEEPSTETPDLKAPPCNAGEESVSASSNSSHSDNLRSAVESLDAELSAREGASPAAGDDDAEPND